MKNDEKWWNLIKIPGKGKKGGCFYRLSEVLAIFALSNCRIVFGHFFHFPAPPRQILKKNGHFWSKIDLLEAIFLSNCRIRSPFFGIPFLRGSVFGKIDQKWRFLIKINDFGPDWGESPRFHQNLSPLAEIDQNLIKNEVFFVWFCMKNDQNRSKMAKSVIDF